MTIPWPKRIECDLYVERITKEHVDVTFVTPMAQQWAVSYFGLRFTQPEDLIHNTLPIHETAFCVALSFLPAQATLFLTENPK